MAVYKQEIKETIEDRLQKAINLGREEMLKEVLKWLKEHCWRRETMASFLMQDTPPSYEIVMNFESEEELFQSFKERFNIE
jgi:hypothetical protein